MKRNANATLRHVEQQPPARTSYMRELRPTALLDEVSDRIETLRWAIACNAYCVDARFIADRIVGNDAD